MTSEKICESLNLDLSKIYNIYPYGSKIYGTSNEYSDDDFIIVFKSALLESGSFKDNAISSEDRMIQGTCYSRGGFIDAINNYQINALECIFLPDELVIQKIFPFKLQKFNEKDFAKNIIKAASSSWYFSKMAFKDEDIERSKKNMYHSIRILDFGIQIKDEKKIYDYSKSNPIYHDIMNDDDFHPKKWNDEFINLSNLLKS